VHPQQPLELFNAELQIFYGRAFLRQQPFFRRIHWVVYQFELDQKGEEILR
jgi:hypothetical protein